MKILLLVILLMSQSAWGETVELKNGTVLKGVIVSMDENDLVIDTAEMGRVTVKRYKVKSISEGDSSEDGKTIINVNNSNNVKQEQNNQQTQNVDVNTDKGEDKRWRQGIQGRFMVGSESAKFDEDSDGTLDYPKSYSGLDWDIVGFRSEGLWAIYLNVSSMSSEKDKLKYTLSGVTIRLDFNLFKQVHGDAMSLFYIGVGVGNGSLSVESESDDGTKTEAELSGSRTVLKVGYDYLMGEHWGLTINGSASTNSLDELTYKVNDMETSSNAVSETKISTTSIAAGLIYNFDW